LTHLALSGGLLGRFQEVVELKAGTPSSLARWSLAPRLPDPGQPPPARSDHDKLTILFDLLDEFLAVDHGGDHTRRRLSHECVLIAQQQPGYDPDLIRYDRSPPPATMSIAEAADALGIDRREVVARIGSVRLGRVGRLGSEPPAARRRRRIRSAELRYLCPAGMVCQRAVPISTEM
jgi:hypothetical protein